MCFFEKIYVKVQLDRNLWLTGFSNEICCECGVRRKSMANVIL
jgi:hypothetical protein